MNTDLIRAARAREDACRAKLAEAAEEFKTEWQREIAACAEALDELESLIPGSLDAVLGEYRARRDERMVKV